VAIRTDGADWHPLAGLGDFASPPAVNHGRTLRPSNALDGRLHFDRHWEPNRCPDGNVDIELSVSRFQGHNQRVADLLFTMFVDARLRLQPFTGFTQIVSRFGSSMAGPVQTSQCSDPAEMLSSPSIHRGSAGSVAGRRRGSSRLDGFTRSLYRATGSFLR
jgi:hypothetical protein